ncbi:MAG TPA: hypothetical protein VL614_00750 [Acetobacteraceae bacterium]|jgi:hypothetical protein|nr:hypothetical protein [Acetobacteraceae bacterium]
MSVSEYTRRICRRICYERYLEMEIARLDRKAEIMHRRPLTEGELARDAEDKAASQRMLEAACPIHGECDL